MIFGYHMGVPGTISGRGNVFWNLKYKLKIANVFEKGHRVLVVGYSVAALVARVRFPAEATVL